MHLLAQIYTAVPLLTLVAGYVIRMIYCRQRAKWLDRHRPLADGELHRVESYNRRVASVALAVFVLGYVLVKTQETQDNTIAGSDRTTRCVAEFQMALSLRSDISAQDFKLSIEIDKLRSENDRALAKFLDRRFNPPSDIAVLDANDPRRLQWRDDITRIFAEWQRDVNRQIEAKQSDREELIIKREQNPLPPIKC